MTYPDNIGDSDRWQDPRDIQGGETDQPAPTPRTDALLLVVDEGRVYKDYGPTVELARQLERELSAERQKYADLSLAYERTDAELQAAKAEAERLREAEAILSWLELQHVEVRTPALYGSFPAFKSFSVAGFDGEEDSPSDLRAQVRAALAATRKEEGNG